MTERLKFQQFKDMLEQCTISQDTLSECVQFDHDSPIPKLKLRNDAPLDDFDLDYEVDRPIYQYSRKRQEEKRAQTKKPPLSGLQSIVAEGDSWFHLPELFGYPPAIANCIDANPRFEMNNIAFWGYTLKDILTPPEDDEKYMEVIAQNSPDFFMLSAGGNDIQVGLAEEDQEKRYIHRYDENRGYDDYLTESGEKGIDEIKAGYKQILDEVTAEFPDLKVFCHGYDYPRPLVDEGEFIGQYLRKLGIPNGKMDEILQPIVDLLNVTIKDVTDTYESVEFINLRGVASIPKFDWIDDIHPDKDGFKALAAKFEEAMSGPGFVA